MRGRLAERDALRLMVLPVLCRTVVVGVCDVTGRVDEVGRLVRNGCKTWVQVPGTRVVRPSQPATFMLKTLAQTNGFVGYHVQMSDADGSAINQTVIRAAFTQPSS